MKIQWRKGHLRDENSATKCKWFEIETVIPTREIPVEQLAIEVPGRKGRTAREVAGAPYDVIKCVSPERLAECYEDIPKDVRGVREIERIVTAIEVCRLCPFHQGK